MNVKKRQVSRWFVAGKGYSSSVRAYRAIAKRLMWEMVSKGKLPLLYKEDDHKERRDLVDTWYGLIFRHTGSAKCRKMCRQWPGVLGHNGAFVFKSCKAAQEEWIEAKVKELREQDSKGEEGCQV